MSAEGGVAPRTLTAHLLDLEERDLTHIINALAVAVRLTASLVARGLAAAGSPGQVSAERWTRHLRREATRSLLAQMSGVRQLAGVSIAGVPKVLPVSDGPGARYLLLVEALHRQSLLMENQSIGLAYSVLERPVGGGACSEADFLQSGSRQVAAGLALYGPATMLVLTTGAGVDGFTLDREVGSFVVTHPAMRIPDDAHLFAINASEAPRWSSAVKRYVEECVQGSAGPRGHNYVMRWNASAVVGVFRTLVQGGVFMVPDTGAQGWPWGVPLLHNAAPLAWLVQQAGGLASTGTHRVLDIVPESLTARVPLICGDVAEVERIERYHRVPAGADEVVTHPLFRSRSLFRNH